MSTSKLTEKPPTFVGPKAANESIKTKTLFFPYLTWSLRFKCGAYFNARVDLNAFYFGQPRVQGI